MNPFHVKNGLTLDFAPSAGGVSDAFLGVDSSGSIVQYATIGVSRITPQVPNRAAAFDANGFLLPSITTLAELAFVSGVTSNIQTQLNSKQSAIVLTANRAVVTNGSGIPIAATTTATEIGFVNGVTSAIQTQLNAKQATITGGATSIVSSNLTVNRALVSDGSGKVIVSAVTATELGYNSGVTSSIQTQLNGKLTVVLTSPSNGDVITYDGANWINSASAAVGVPIGGTAGQYLNKIDGTNYNTQWSTLVLAAVTDVTATAAEVNVLSGITTSTTQLNYLNSTTSNVQSQINSKLSSSLSQNAIWYGNASNIAVELSPGTSGYVLTSVGGVPTWQPSSGGGGGISGPGSSTDNAIVRWDGILGTVVQDSSVTVGDTGIITGGTWQGNLILGQYGGTGVANTGKTITLGGNLTTSGAFNTTFTVTGSNTITFPNASITVARIDAAQTFTGVQTFSSMIVLPNQSANTVLAGPTSGGAATPAFRALVASDIPSLASLYWPLTGTANLVGDVILHGAGNKAISLGEVGGQSLDGFTVQAEGDIFLGDLGIGPWWKIHFGTYTEVFDLVKYYADYSGILDDRSLVDFGTVKDFGFTMTNKTLFQPVFDDGNLPITIGWVPTAIGTDGTWEWAAPTGGGGTVVSVSGTANRITSTGGSTPVIDISASYVGQSSITTLGTITTGTWNATVLAGLYGGTGVANSGKTITLGGNLTTSGAFNTTFTVTGSNTITFPNASITVARIDAAQTFTGVNTFSSIPVFSSGIGSATATTQAAGDNSTKVATTAYVDQYVITTPIALNLGGTAANLTASNGGIVYSTASALAILSGTATANKLLLSGSSTTPAWSAYTVPSSVGTTGNVLTSDGTNWISSAPTGSGGRLDQITAATTTATIDSTSNAIAWQWNTLAGATGLALSSSSTAAASNAQILVSAALTGANGTSAQTTIAFKASNAHTGTTSTNVGASFSASGGTNNYGIQVIAGRSFFGDSTNYYTGVAGLGALTNGYLEINTSATPAITFSKNSLTDTTSLYWNGTNFTVRNSSFGGVDLYRIFLDTRHIFSSFNLGAVTGSSGTSFLFGQGNNVAGTPTFLDFQAGSHTNLTTATEFNDVLFTLNRTVTVADGTVATQRQMWIKGVTLNGVTTLTTWTNAYSLYIDAPSAGAKGAFTNGPWALGVNGNMAIASKTYFGAISGTVFGLATFAANSTTVPQLSLNTGGSLLTTPSGGALEVKSGLYFTNSAGVRLGLGGNALNHLTDAASPANTSENDLYVDTLAASFLTTNGDTIKAKYAVQLLSTGGATKRVRVYFGGTVIYDSNTASILAGTDMSITVTIVRTSSSTVTCLVCVVTSTSAIGSTSTITKITGLTLSGTNVLKISGQSGAGAASGDITAVAGLIEQSTGVQ